VSFAQRLEASYAYLRFTQDHLHSTVFLVVLWNIMNGMLAYKAPTHAATAPCVIVTILASAHILRKKGCLKLQPSWAPRFVPVWCYS